MYYKMTFRHLRQFFREPSYLHEDIGYLFLLASSEHISKDSKRAENLPPVLVYFCLQLGKAEHWQHWVGNLGLSLGCYLMCQLKIKKSPSNNEYYLQNYKPKTNNFKTDSALKYQACYHRLTCHTYKTVC